MINPITKSTIALADGQRHQHTEQRSEETCPAGTHDGGGEQRRIGRKMEMKLDSTYYYY